MKVLDLFSGIGGFSLGFESTGYFQTTKFVEMDKFCKQILEKNFPGIPIEEDIKNVKGKEFEADVITGGFPCQPFSVAGKQRGTSDDRYLWPEMFRLIKEIKPKWVVGENVSGLINLQEGMVLRQVQDDLEGEGFEVQCFIIPASGIGAWHQRKRIWIVAYSERNGQLASKKQRSIKKTISEKQEGSNHSLNTEGTSSLSTTKTNVADTKSKRAGENNERLRPRISGVSRGKRTSRIEEDVSNTESFRRGEPRDINQTQGSKKSGSTQFNSSSEDVSNTNDTRDRTSEHGLKRKGKKINEGRKGQSQFELSRHSENFSNTESLRTQGLWTFWEQESNPHGEEELSMCESEDRKKSWWEIESNLCGVPDGLSYELDKARASRIKSLGNSIVPQIARQIALSIIKAEEDF